MVLTCWKRKVGTMVAPQLCEERAAEGHTRPWSGCRQQGSRTKAKQGNHLPGFPSNTEVLTPDNHPKHPQGSARYTQRQKKRGEGKISLSILPLPSSASAGDCREQNTKICSSSDTSHISAPHDWWKDWGIQIQQDFTAEPNEKYLLLGFVFHQHKGKTQTDLKSKSDAYKVPA